MENIAEKVNAIAKDCFPNDDELENGWPSDAVLVDGIVAKFGFHPGRLESHRQEVKEIIDLMPRQFRAGTGGGWSFLNLCLTEAGEQWGEHSDMELLVVLAIGLGLGKFQMPRELWSVLPGGMPYVVFE